MVFEVGDWTTPTLTVDPFDGTTAATLAVVSPAGVTTTPSVSTSDGGRTWVASPYEWTSPGEWVERWTVTGTGKSKERRIVQVAPDPVPDLTGRRVYATTRDLADYLLAAPPPGQRRVLVRASERIEELLLTAVYAVDAAGLPTDANIARSIADAVCAQAQWWYETGDELGLASQYQSVSIGRVSLGRAQAGNSGGGAQRYAEQALVHLRLARSTDGVPLFPGTTFH